jgi:hypothetical protein
MTRVSLEQEDILVIGILPVVDPESSWHSFNAGNLKKMNRNSVPSKKHEVNARVRMFLFPRMSFKADFAGACTCSSLASSASRLVASAVVSRREP